MTPPDTQSRDRSGAHSWEGAPQRASADARPPVATQHCSSAGWCRNTLPLPTSRIVRGWQRRQAACRNREPELVGVGQTNERLGHDAGLQGQAKTTRMAFPRQCATPHEITRSKHEHTLHTTPYNLWKSRPNQCHPSPDGRIAHFAMAASRGFSAVCATCSIDRIGLEADLRRRGDHLT